MDNRSQVAGGFFVICVHCCSIVLFVATCVFPAEPERRGRSDETSGQHVTNFELELKVNADCS